VATIVSDQWYGVPHRAGGDPEVIIADEPMRAGRGLQPALESRIGLADLKVVRDDGHRLHPFLEKGDLLRSPFSPFGPVVKLAHSYEGNRDGPALNVRPVEDRSWITPAQEVREDIGIEEDFIHGAPSYGSRNR